MNKSQALNQIVVHVIATLPDSFSARGELLTAVLLFVPQDSSCADRVLLLRELLTRHEALRQTTPQAVEAQ